MGQFKQVVVGAALLTLAFFVGSHFSGGIPEGGHDPLNAETLSADDLVWHAGEQEPASTGRDEGSIASSFPTEDWGVPPQRHLAPESSGSVTSPAPALSREAQPSFAMPWRGGQDSAAGELQPIDPPHVTRKDAGPARDSATAGGEVELGLLRPPFEDTAGRESMLGESMSRALPAASEIRREPRSVADLSPLLNRSQRHIQRVVESFQLHIVRPGESLPSITQHYLGSPDFYLDIYLANQDILTSPAGLTPGQSLKIPK